MMEQNKKELLMEQANKIEDVLNVLRTQFGEDYEDEVNYLKIVKKGLEEASVNNNGKQEIYFYRFVRRMWWPVRGLYGIKTLQRTCSHRVGISYGTDPKNSSNNKMARK